MIAIQPHEGEDFVVELDGKLIGKQAFGASRRSASSSTRPIGGRGYAAEALTLVLERAFRRSRPREGRSRRRSAQPRLAKAPDPPRFPRNWTQRAHRLVGGRWCDSVYLELDAAELEQATAHEKRAGGFPPALSSFSCERCLSGGRP